MRHAKKRNPVPDPPNSPARPVQQVRARLHLLHGGIQEEHAHANIVPRAPFVVVGSFDVHDHGVVVVRARPFGAERGLTPRAGNVVMIFDCLEEFVVRQIVVVGGAI